MDLVLLVLLLFPGSCFGKVVHGYLRTGDNWAFVSRFCFLSVHGKFEYEVQYESKFGVQNLNLYNDGPSVWQRVYGWHADLTSCTEKESVLEVEKFQFINLTAELAVSGCVEVPGSKLPGARTTSRIKCKGTRTFQSARERWWFLAVSNCNSTKGLQLSYRLVMTNGEEGDLLHHHFSADEFYILPILIICLIEHLVLLGLSVWSAVLLKMRQLLHVTYKLFMLSVFLHTAGIFLLGSHYMVYAFDGEGLLSAKMHGSVFEAAANIIFLLLLILVAKGYNVTRARLRSASSVKLAVFICLYTLTHATLFVFETRYFDPGKVLYRYESLAGYGLIVLGPVGWLMFIYSTFFTLKHYPEKGGFYYPFFCFYTLWFMAGPTIIVISNHIIAQWVREKVVVSVEHFVVFLGHTVFLMLTRPNAHNKNFPYHVRTGQIDILEEQAANNQVPMTVEGTTLDAFAHGGTYSVSDHRAAMDIFTVDSVGSRSRQLTTSLPPPYSLAPATSAGSRPRTTSSSAGAGRRVTMADRASSPTWAENSTRKNSAKAAMNGLATTVPGNAILADELTPSAPKIFDPNEEDEVDVLDRPL